MIILITYRLTPNRDYSSFFEAIKSSPATTWSHYIDSTWLVKTTETPAQMAARFKQHINAGTDIILITKIDASDYNGWLPPNANKWIKENR